MAGQGQNPEHMLLRRGQHHIAAAAPGQRLHPQQGTKRAAIDEVERRHVDDQALTPRQQGRDGRLGIRRPGNIQIPAQGHDNATLAYAGLQLYTWHDAALCHTGRGEVWTQRLGFFDPRSQPTPLTHTGQGLMPLAEIVIRRPDTNPSQGGGSACLTGWDGTSAFLIHSPVPGAPGLFDPAFLRVVELAGVA